MVSVAESRLKLSDGNILVEIIIRRRYKDLKNYSGMLLHSICTNGGEMVE